MITHKSLIRMALMIVVLGVCSLIDAHMGLAASGIALMSIFGAVGLEPGDYQFARQMGQEILYNVSVAYAQRIQMDMDKAYSVFVQGQTSKHSERYKLPGVGEMQVTGRDGSAAATRPYGGWDVAYPIEILRDKIAGNNVDIAHMTPADFERAVQSIGNRSVAGYRRRMLKALFNNVAQTFVDEENGTLTVQPLANGDSVQYPPLIGATSFATRNRYAGANFLATAIDDDNNPIAIIVNALENDFGQTTGDDEIVVFINSAEAEEVKALSDFVPVPSSKIIVGDNTAVPTGLPNVPGKILGTCSGAWVVQWNFIPATYMVGIHMGEPAPLMERIFPAETGLVAGLHLEVPMNDWNVPMIQWDYVHMYGLGVGNRLNGYVLHVTNSTSYTIPAAFQ